MLPDIVKVRGYKMDLVHPQLLRALWLIMNLGGHELVLYSPLKREAVLYDLRRTY